ncbi:efflux RND transporter periplasmic adaptor subunit [Teredinibacter sp. KSP-S5-2]|uniref:efflux RND transporter periplasmic adaptor subunit n=1 Tax=Teredinibacter sp. KSP-S5-2 TaxID=3034506 RepID=UPI002935111F|nr:efflux RND transporter periplasmic adaptor subunit [Teredinibacter sp. KSP-S5-2]WNO10766.1 efflux RND transporter periplasmic adaptor subunit [Teredinibacter sp. KSP-S5-2]
MKKIWFLAGLLLSPLVDSAPVPVEIAEVQWRPFSTKIEALGSLQANESVTLSATVTETIRAIHFKDGQVVKANQVLVEMTSNEEHALLEEARSEYNEAKRQFDRVKSLEAKQLASLSLLDERTQLLEASEARLLATQSRLEERLIIAPFSGVVGLRDISVGALVKPGDEIVTLDDLTQMKLDISLPAVYLSTVQKGMAITATTPYINGESFSGEVSSIDSRIDTSTRAIRVRAILPNPKGKLLPGMLMTVNLTTPVVDQLLIPEASLVQEGFRQYVYVVAPADGVDKVNKQQVTTGARNNGEVVVMSGLNAGDRIVVHGILRLRDQSEIRILPANFSK